ncbi:MAG: FlgO family outer membrane protein [Elusimicrobia bacterium]|nr:FlgO family outer membrane protein [Elusimicrobiota bacterium]
MKNVYCLIFSLMIVSGCYSAKGIVKKPFQNIQEDKKLKIAVVNFENRSGDKSYDSLMGGISGTLIDELQKTKSFRIIERQRLETILSELKFNMTGLIDPQKAKQVGQQLGVDAFLFGNLSSIKYSSNKQTLVIMWTEGQKTDVLVDARIVNVESGEIIATAKASSYVKQRKWVAFGFAKLGKTIEKNSIIQTGIDLSCRQIAIDLASEVSK